MAFLAAVPAALQIAGVVLSAVGMAESGANKKKAASSEAAQLAKRAAARRAESQYAAEDERRQARLVQSRALAVAAAGGGSIADPTIVNIMGDIEAEGEIAALSRLYEGYEESGGLEDAAVLRRREGRAAQSAGLISAASTTMQGVATLRSKYN